MRLRDFHLDQHRRQPASRVRDITTDRRLADPLVVFSDEALPDPPRSVPLLAWHLAIRDQPLVDRRLPRLEDRRHTLDQLAW